MNVNLNFFKILCFFILFNLLFSSSLYADQFSKIKSFTINDQKYFATDRLKIGGIKVVYNGHYFQPDKSGSSLKVKKMPLAIAYFKREISYRRNKEALSILKNLAINDPFLLKIVDYGSFPDPSNPENLIQVVISEMVEESTDACFVDPNSYFCNVLRPNLLKTQMINLLNSLSNMHRTLVRPRDRNSGLCHFDIKPANIFIKEQSNGKNSLQLGDFDLAKPCPKMGQDGSRKYKATDYPRNKRDYYALYICYKDFLKKSPILEGRPMELLQHRIKAKPKSKDEVEEIFFKILNLNLVAGKEYEYENQVRYILEKYASSLK